MQMMNEKKEKLECVKQLRPLFFIELNGMKLYPCHV